MKAPSGARMHRTQPLNAKLGRHERDIKKAYTTEQLSEIGAIALIWNQIEIIVDFLLLVVLKLSPVIWLEVAKRINGMDGKLEILRRFYEHNDILTEPAKQCLKHSLDAIAEYKKYRDAIVHSLLFDVDKGIAQHIGSRAKINQVLLTIDALTGLYNRMNILLEELQHVDLLFRLGDADAAKTIYGGKVGE